MPSDLEIQLIAEQLRHALDLTKAQLESVKERLEHEIQLKNLQLEQLKSNYKSLLDRDSDFENRIRDVTSGVIQSRFFIGLVGAALLMSLFSLIKAFFF